MIQFLSKLFLLSLLLFSGSLNAQSPSNAYFIQVATYADPQYKDFSKISKVGYLFATPQDNGLYKIYMGTYASKATAYQRLQQVKAKGYKDAFVARVPIIKEDAVYIVQLATLDQKDDIYWGDWQRMTSKLVVQLSADKVRISSGPFYNRQDAEAAMAAIKNRGGRSDIFIKTVSYRTLHQLTDFEMQHSSSYGKSTAVRTTIKSLQAALNYADYYKSKVDGQWGPNTQASLEKYKNENTNYLKYLSLSEQKVFNSSVEQYTLQYYLDMIERDAFGAEEGLKAFKHPLAKVYLAYLYLNGDIKIENSNQQVNQLMNEAIDQTFKGYRLKTRYDFTQHYAYDDIKQLIMHLRAVHEAVKDEPNVPCWLFRRHPQLAAEAFAPYWNNERDEYKVSADCGSFLDLPQMQILLTIVADMSANAKVDHLAQINQLYAFPRAMPYEEMKKLESWNFSLWKGLKEWSESSPLQNKTFNTLKIAYYDALRVIENYFIKKGFSNRDARGMGLQTLKLALDSNLSAYY